ncbi:MAG: ATP synthase F1 subunit epsilon [Prevotellaceae bacterium]|nr:ATP synthase F1 subunit epsilon [Prevotellaceae bacterium]
MLHLRIVSPAKIEFEGDVNMVKVPGAAGEFEILDKHAAILSVLQKGIVEYEPLNQERVQMEVIGGFVEVEHNEVSLCVEKV